MTKKFFRTKEFIVKAIIVAIVLLATGLSFLFSDKLEIAFGLRQTFGEFECDKNYVLDSDYFVTYLDVGQGNCTFIKLPDGKTVLIDAGNTMYGKTVTDFLKDNKVSQIDYLIASHADSDHIGGFLAVLDEFEAKNIFRPFQICGSGSTFETFVPSESEDLASVYDYYVNEYGRNSKISRVTTSVYNDFIEKVYSETYKSGVLNIASEVTVFYDGLKISGEGYNIEFYAPAVRDENLNLRTMSRTNGFATVGYGASSSNDNSAVFVLDCAGTTYLFSGDASFEGGSQSSYEEIDFVNSLTASERASLSEITVYLVGHHGSAHSSSALLLEVICPKFFIISVGENNSYGHPDSKALERIKSSKNFAEDRLLMTSEQGTIWITGSDGEAFFACDVGISKTTYSISWELLASIIAIVICILVCSFKPRSRRTNSLTAKKN